MIKGAVTLVNILPTTKILKDDNINTFFFVIFLLKRELDEQKNNR